MSTFLKEKIKELEVTLETSKVHFEYLDADGRILKELLDQVDYDPQSRAYIQKYLLSLEGKLIDIKASIIAETQLLEYYRMASKVDEDSSMPLH
jgi:hypothetical protein